MIKHRYIVSGYNENSELICQLVTAYTREQALHLFKEKTGYNFYTLRNTLVIAFGQVSKNFPIGSEDIAEHTSAWWIIRDYNRSIQNKPEEDSKRELVKIPCRCKDCSFYEIYTPYRKNDKLHLCNFWNYNTGDGELPNEVSPDGFCSNGEKKQFLEDV